MTLKQKGGESSADAKKKRRVGFASIDAGIEANECIKVFLVRSQDEVGATNISCIDPFDLSHFFGEDGKIYGYKNIKINVWLSLISFHAYADITFESTFDGGKGITDLNPALQNIFGESLLEKEEFIQTFSKEIHYIRTIMSDGAVTRCDPLRKTDGASDTHINGDCSKVEVLRSALHNMPVGLLYSRLVPLILLLVEGSRPVDVTDPKWEIYFIVKKIEDDSGGYRMYLLGFATVYRFYHYPDTSRLRISQILVLPPYQSQGHGCRLLESIYSVALSESLYDVTVEEPSDYLQQQRVCVDTLRLLTFEPIMPAVNSVLQYLKDTNLSKRTEKSIYKAHFGPPRHVTDIVRQKLKINKKQFRRCWDVLIYLNLDPNNNRCVENFKACVSDHVKDDILDKDSETNGKRLIEVPNDYDHDMTFVVMWSKDGTESDGTHSKPEGDQVTQEEQLNQLVEKEMEDIVEMAKKVSSRCK